MPTYCGTYILPSSYDRVTEFERSMIYNTKGGVVVVINHQCLSNPTNYNGYFQPHLEFANPCGCHWRWHQSCKLQWSINGLGLKLEKTLKWLLPLSALDCSVQLTVEIQEFLRGPQLWVWFNFLIVPHEHGTITTRRIKHIEYCVHGIDGGPPCGYRLR